MSKLPIRAITGKLYDIINFTHWHNFLYTHCYCHSHLSPLQAFELSCKDKSILLPESMIYLLIFLRKDPQEKHSSNKQEQKLDAFHHHKSIPGLLPNYGGKQSIQILSREGDERGE